MQPINIKPLRITIWGDFWETQIYRGRLYLWGMNGDLKVVNWNNLIDSLDCPDKERVAMKFAFTDSNLLYGESFLRLSDDEEIRNTMLSKFSSLAERTFIVEEKDLDKYLYGRQDNPFDELPTSTEIYDSVFYVITDSGLWSAKTHRNTKRNPVATQPNKLWDCKLLSLLANNYGQIALSAGDEGLFEIDAGKYASDHNISQVFSNHSLFSNWSYHCIYSSSNISDSFMALYTLKKGNDRRKHRIFERIMMDMSIFNSNDSHNLSWAYNDKIYRAVNNKIQVVRFNPFKKKKTGSPLLSREASERAYFSEVKDITLQAWKGDVLYGGTSLFGTIIECENAMVVCLSNDTNYTIDGPISKWRVYPRSINYENHLHVIHEDRLEIYSFNNDYFVDQSAKDFGAKYYQKRYWGR